MEQKIKIKLNGKMYDAVITDFTPLNDEKKNEVNIPDYPPLHYIMKLSNYWKVGTETTKEILKLVYSAAPGAFISLCGYTIANEIDSFYSDNIRNCKGVFIINKSDGKICPIDTEKVSKNIYKYAGLFRTKEEAIYAIKTIKGIKSFIFDEQKSR